MWAYVACALAVAYSVAIVYKAPPLDDKQAPAVDRRFPPPDLRLVRQGLLAAAGGARQESLTFAVGLNAAVDLIVPATDLFRALQVEPGATQDHQALSSLEEVQECFAHAFQTGTAAERVFTDPQTYKRIVETAMSLPSHKLYAGGNAALIGDHILTTDVAKKRRVVLVAGVGKTLKGLLPRRMEVPVVATDDEVHLILEYGKGETWGSHTSPRANRFIFSHDRTNAELRPLDAFSATLKEVGDVDVLVVSGIHMLVGEPAEFQRKRISDVVSFLDSVDPATPIHLELACIEDLDFMRLIAANLLRRVDSLGLNEQEFAALGVAAGAPHAEVLASGVDVPEVGLIGDLMEWAFAEFGRDGSSGMPSRLTRVHFHSLTFHVLGSLPGSWSHTKEAVAVGTLTCSRRACESPELDVAKYDLMFPKEFSLSKTRGEATRKLFHEESPVTEWSRGGVQYALSPVFVCKVPTKTVGLGDSISASGLERSVFRR